MCYRFSSISSHIVLLVINNEIISDFEKEWCTFDTKKNIWKYKKKKKKDYPQIDFECFKHA
jgi:hypothetical protein